MSVGEGIATVTYQTIDGWELTETHMWLGEDIADMPQARNGNPKVGNFPYHSGDITGATSYVFTVPLAEIGFNCPASDDTLYYIAAHAAMRKDDGAGGYQTETGWAEGERIVERGNWAMTFNFTLSCDCAGGEDPVSCETAFAFGQTQLNMIPDLLNGGFITTRWGWQLGAVQPGDSGEADIWAGAGNNNTGVAEHVGILSYEYFGGDGLCSVNVTYDFSRAQSSLVSWFMEATHLYVGTEQIQTAAPGQFGNQHESLNQAFFDAYNLQWDSGVFGCEPIYLVAHAEACYLDNGDF
ncbi:MAG: hypothetical protein Tsb002_05070 [Wenzhouxiangellaceae bacterium]